MLIKRFFSPCHIISGIKLAYSQEKYFDNDVAVVTMDGSFDNIQELVYVESNLGNSNSKFYGEVTQAMLR